MRITVLYPALFMMLFFNGCMRQPDCIDIFIQIEEEFNAGNLKKTGLLADSLKEICGEEKLLIHKADSLLQIADRIYLDFLFTGEQIISQDVRYLADSIAGQEENLYFEKWDYEMEIEYKK